MPGRGDHWCEPVVRDRSGWWDDRPEGRIYLFNADGMREALKGFDFKRGLDLLQEAGVIEPPGANGKRARSHKIAGRVGKFYEVSTDALEAAMEAEQ